MSTRVLLATAAVVCALVVGPTAHARDPSTFDGNTVFTVPGEPLWAGVHPAVVEVTFQMSPTSVGSGWTVLVAHGSSTLLDFALLVREDGRALKFVNDAGEFERKTYLGDGGIHTVGCELGAGTQLVVDGRALGRVEPLPGRAYPDRGTGLDVLIGAAPTPMLWASHPWTGFRGEVEEVRVWDDLPPRVWDGATADARTNDPLRPPAFSYRPGKGEIGSTRTFVGATMIPDLPLDPRGPGLIEVLASDDARLVRIGGVAKGNGGLSMWVVREDEVHGTALVPSVPAPPGPFDLVDLRSSPVLGLFGKHDGQRVTAIGVRTTAASTWIVPPTGGDAPFAFDVSVPSTALFRGLAWVDRGDGIRQVGLLWALREPTEAAVQIDRFTQGRWVEESAPSPQRDDTFALSQGLVNPVNGTVAPHGNYTTPRVYRLLRVPGGEEVDLLWEESGELQRERFAQMSAEPWVWKGQDGTRLSLAREPEGMVLIRDDGAVRLVRPTPYEDAESAEKLPWGATFSLADRPTLVTANFAGYNLLTLHPLNLQVDATGHRRLFDYPTEDSRSYSTTNSRLIVPHGLLLRPDTEGRETTRVQSLSNAAEHQFSHAWKAGGSVGVEVPGLFSANVEFQYGQSSMASRRASHGSQWTVAESIATHYALVLDQGLVDLDEEFAARVHRLLERSRAGVDLSVSGDFEDFWTAFGTHYPYAVTYGGMVHLREEHTEDEVREMLKKGTTVEVKASGGIKGATVGDNFSDDREDEKTAEYGTTFGSDELVSVGGTFSRGGGWSLTHGEEVPVFMDLRPIWELFSPLYFSDPGVWEVLRPALREALRKRFGDAVAPPPQDLLPVAGWYRMDGMADLALGTSGSDWGKKTFQVRVKHGRLYIPDTALLRGLQLQAQNHHPSSAGPRSRTPMGTYFRGWGQFPTFRRSVGGSPFEVLSPEFEAVVVRDPGERITHLDLKLSDVDGKTVRIRCTRLSGHVGSWIVPDEVRHRFGPEPLPKGVAVWWSDEGPTASGPFQRLRWEPATPSNSRTDLFGSSAADSTFRTVDSTTGLTYRGKAVRQVYLHVRSDGVLVLRVLLEDGSTEDIVIRDRPEMTA